MLSLPIPYARSPVRYGDLVWSGRSVGELVERLTRSKVRRTDFAHLDPDLRSEFRTRPPGWKPALGQHKSAQAHLRRNHVRAGDLFLFFGLFRRVDDGLQWIGERLHVIWGWLQVGDVFAVDTLRAASPEHWTRNHPHLDFDADPTNTLYVSSESLTLPGNEHATVDGAGVFDTFSPARQLTAAGRNSPTLWSLPGAFAPGARHPLTYHARPDRWRVENDRVLLSTVARGQEFVLDTAEYPDVLPWVSELLAGR